MATYTTSIPSSASSPAQSPYARAIPNRPANSFADASVREATATTSASASSRTSAVNAAAMPPVARIAPAHGPVLSPRCSLSRHRFMAAS